MYAKVTTYQIDPSRIVEMNTVLGELKARIMSLPGIKSSNTVWREDGHGVSMSIYDCRASAEEAGPGAQSHLGPLQQYTYSQTGN